MSLLIAAPFEAGDPANIPVPGVWPRCRICHTRDSLFTSPDGYRCVNHRIKERAA